MWTTFTNWWAQPFDSKGSVVNWFLFLGLILVLMMLWARLIRMFEAVGEVV